MQNLDSKTFFAFGGGVQSTAIALLLIHEPHKLLDLGLTLPKTIIFADTGAEPKAIYDHVNQIFEMLSRAEYDTVVVQRIEKNGSIITIHEQWWGLASIPWFTRSLDGQVGMLKRQCTEEFKIKPIQKEIRARLGYKKGQRIPPLTAKLWLGISVDEQRRAKINQDKWLNNKHPLIYLGWNRNDCAVYNYLHLNRNVSKSSCFFCPFKHRQEWMRMRQEEPDEFARAVAVDKKIRHLVTIGKCRQDVFVHSSGLPLEDAVLDQLSLPLGIDYGFGKECAGHCGV